MFNSLYLMRRRARKRRVRRKAMKRRNKRRNNLAMKKPIQIVWNRMTNM